MLILYSFLTAVLNYFILTCSLWFTSIGSIPSFLFIYYCNRLLRKRENYNPIKLFNVLDNTTPILLKGFACSLYKNTHKYIYVKRSNHCFQYSFIFVIILFFNISSFAFYYQLDLLRRERNRRKQEREGRRKRKFSCGFSCWCLDIQPV